MYMNDKMDTEGFFATSNGRQHAIATFESWDEWDDIYAVCSFNEERKKTVKKPHIFEHWDEWSDITGWDTETIQRRLDTAEIDLSLSVSMVVMVAAT